MNRVTLISHPKNFGRQRSPDSTLMHHAVGSGAKRVFAFIDTNVLLHYRFFRHVNWAKELSAEEATLVFAPVVVEELDKRKWAGARRERARARKVLKALKDLQLSVTPVAMREDVKIMALDEEPPDALFVRHRLQPRISDDRLLASVLAFMETQHRSAAILVLTADMGLSLKAPTRQIDVAVPDEHLRMDDEPDETERGLIAARRELAALRAVAPKPKLTLAGENVLEHQVRRFGAFSAGTLAHLLEAWRSKHPYINLTPDSIVVPGGSRISLAGLRGLSGFWSEKDANKHNAKIDRVYGDYETFLRRWPTQLNALARCIEMRFVLENEGTAPADDVDLLITARANGMWLDEFPEIPTAPVVPRPRNPFELGSMPWMGSFDPSSLRRRDDPIDGPNVLEDDPQSVRYTVKRVKHHVPCVLPVVFFQLDSHEDIRSFTVPYRLVAANLQEPKSDNLHVKLSVSTVVEPPSPEELLRSRGDEDDDSARDDEGHE